MGNRVARAAGKKQTRRKGAKRAKPSAGRSRTGKRLALAGAKKRARAKASSRKRAVKKRPAKRTAAKKRAATAKRAPAKRTSARTNSVAVERAGAPSMAPPTMRAGDTATGRGAVAAARPVIRPAAPPAAFSVQRAGATMRDQLFFELQRARASVKAAIQGLSSANAGRPIAPGKWSPLEIVLHLGERDRVRLEEFARTLGGQPRTWAGVPDAVQASVNEAHLAPLRAHSWDDAVRRLDALREALLLRLHEVPALPDDVWHRTHAFGDMMWGLPEHDRHHAEQLKRARIGEPLPVED